MMHGGMRYTWYADCGMWYSWGPGRASRGRGVGVDGHPEI